jgi:hypothetical protein
MAVSIEDGVLALVGTIDTGERADPQFGTCSLGGFARLFRPSPKPDHAELAASASALDLALDPINTEA